MAGEEKMNGAKNCEREPIDRITFEGGYFYPDEEFYYCPYCDKLEICGGK